MGNLLPLAAGFDLRETEDIKNSFLYYVKYTTIFFTSDF